MAQEFKTFAKVAGVNDELGIVFGYAMTSKVDGADYTDLQGHVLDESAMLKAALGYAESSREAKEQHQREGAGSVPFIFPMTSAIALALGIETNRHGMLIGMKPDAAMLAKFKSGELSGFSIGGTLHKFEELE